MNHTTNTQALAASIRRALSPAGESAASIVTSALVDAEVRGQTRFGLALLAQLPDDSRDALVARLTLDDADLVRTGASIRVEAGGKFGPAVVGGVIDLARRIAAEYGVCLVRLVDLSEFGQLRPYAAAVADRGGIALLSMASGSHVAPYGGNRPALGTNPFAVAIPTDVDPLVVDTASSAVTLAQWRDAKEGRAELPGDALVDADGRLTGSPDEGVAIAPRGGAFGTVLAIAVEALASGATGVESVPGSSRRGGVLVVVDPDGDAGAPGQHLVEKLVAAGGRVPGRPVPWPDRVVVDGEAHAHLARLVGLVGA